MSATLSSNYVGDKRSPLRAVIVLRIPPQVTLTCDIQEDLCSCSTNWQSVFDWMTSLFTLKLINTPKRQDLWIFIHPLITWRFFLVTLPRGISMLAWRHPSVWRWIRAEGSWRFLFNASEASEVLTNIYHLLLLLLLQHKHSALSGAAHEHITPFQTEHFSKKPINTWRCCFPAVCFHSMSQWRWCLERLNAVRGCMWQGVLSCMVLLIRICSLTFHHIPSAVIRRCTWTSHCHPRSEPRCCCCRFKTISWC